MAFIAAAEAVALSAVLLISPLSGTSPAGPAEPPCPDRPRSIGDGAGRGRCPPIDTHNASHALESSHAHNEWTSSPADQNRLVGNRSSAASHHA